MGLLGFLFCLVDLDLRLCVVFQCKASPPVDRGYLI